MKRLVKYALLLPQMNAPVAQLDRASASEAEGYWFDPSRAHHYWKSSLSFIPILISTFIISAPILAAEPASLKERVQKEHYPDRSVKAEFRYAGGLLNGESRFYHPDGSLAETCEYKDGRPEGALKKFYRDGTLESETHVRGDRHHGPRKSYYPNGTLRSEANFADDQLSGTARQYYPSGTLKNEEMFEDDRIVGAKKTYYPDGRLMSEACCYEEGLLKGESRIFYETGELEWILPFVNGRIHGLAVAAHPGGAAKARVNYKEGLWDGASVEFYPSGAKLSEARFSAGTGLEKRYYPTGELKSEVPYIANAGEGLARSFRQNGSVEFEDVYRDGEKISRKMLDPGGRILFRQSYTDRRLDLLLDLDKKRGSGEIETVAEMHPDGWIKSVRRLKNGEPHGIWDEYHEGFFEWVRYRDVYWYGRRIHRREYDHEGRQTAVRSETNLYELILRTFLGRTGSASSK